MKNQATMKVAKKNLGREIRKATGIDLPAAMTVAAVILRHGSGTGYWLHMQPRPFTRTIARIVDMIQTKSGWDWEGRYSPSTFLVGPKGSYSLG
jgi:hypothetical protein